MMTMLLRVFLGATSGPVNLGLSARQQDLEETVRFAAAAGTLNVTRHGLGTGRLEDIVALSQHVRIRPLGEAA